MSLRELGGLSLDDRSAISIYSPKESPRGSTCSNPTASSARNGGADPHVAESQLTLVAPASLCAGERSQGVGNCHTLRRLVHANVVSGVRDARGRPTRSAAVGGSTR